MRYFLILSFLASGLFAQSSLRVVPEGTRLENGLISPIYLVEYTAAQEEDPGNPRDAGKGQAHLRLKDAKGTNIHIYVKRGTDVDLDGTETPTLRLFLNRPDGALGSREIDAGSKEERGYLVILRSANENYAPGWTKNWSIQNHNELKQLIADVYARNP